MSDTTLYQRLKMPHWRWDLVALIAGAIFPLAFAPFEWRPLGWLSLAGLYFVIQEQSGKRAFLRGWLWGLGAFMVGISWVYNSMHVYGGSPPAAAISFTVIFAAYLALYPGLTGLLWQKLFAAKASTWWAAVGFALIWPITEWLRAWVLTGFPWLMTGFAQLDTPFGNLLPVGGVLVSSGVVALCVAVLVNSAVKNCWKHTAIIVVPAVVISFLLGLINWQESNPKEIDVAIVQGNIPQEIKLQTRYLDVSLNAYESLSEPHYDADLIVWPETAMPTYADYLRDFIIKMERNLAEENATVFTGIFLEAENGIDYYNAMLEIGGTGQTYIKHQLVPFGEYMPVRWIMKLFSRFVDIPKSDMASGPLLEEPMVLGGVTASASICYEMGYPDVLRAQLPEAVLMINTSNDAWFGDSFAPHQHLEMTRARAKEFARPIARATNTGVTGFVDSAGEVLGVTEQFKPNSLRKVLQTNQKVTPFTVIGQDGIGIILALFLGLFIFLVRKSV